LALLLVGRDLMARASELASITAESIKWDEHDGTAQVSLRRRETSTKAHPLQLGEETSVALRRWLDAAGIAAGPVFIGLTKGGKLTTGRATTDGRHTCVLSRQDLGRILKSLAKRAKLPPDFSAHSLRRGYGSRPDGGERVSPGTMQVAGWKAPEMLTRYTADLVAKHSAVARYRAARHK